MMSDYDMSDEVRLGAAHRGGHADETHGLQALNGQASPLEQLMAYEEEDELVDPAQVRPEVMAGLVGWCFCDGRPEQPELAAARLYAIAREFFPSLLVGVKVRLRGVCGAESFGWLEREVFGDGPCADLRRRTARGLLVWFFAEGRLEDPVRAARKLYAVAKAYYPELLKGASLEQLGVWFEPGKSKYHRQRWSARLKVWVTDPIEANEGVGHLKFQKSASASLAYEAAQQGNQNRKTKVS